MVESLKEANKICFIFFICFYFDFTMILKWWNFIFHYDLWTSFIFLLADFPTLSSIYRSMESITSPIPQQVFWRPCWESPWNLRKFSARAIPREFLVVIFGQGKEDLEAETQNLKVKQPRFLGAMLVSGRVKSNSQGDVFECFWSTSVSWSDENVNMAANMLVFFVEVNGQRNGISSSRWLVFLFFPFFQSVLR